MTRNQQNHYKDELPANTVKRIIGILEKYNIELEETWLNTCSAGTYTLRIHVKGSSIGSNGKGITKELARASAYSEFMERYQNLWLARWNHLWKDNFSFQYFIDEKKMTAEKLLEQDSPFLRMFFSHQGIADMDDSEKLSFFKKTQKLNYSLTGNKEHYLTLPFYHINSDSMINLPYFTYTPYYLSNGMCAGNTSEEALVQGFSEIVERMVHKMILTKKIELPDIPDEYISRYPEVYAKYSKLRNESDYYVVMKDCSLGGKFPVAGLLIVEKNTGRYGIKFGCHPDYGIAMERTITEAAQIGNILQYSHNSDLDFYNERVSDKTNILNGFKTGLCQFPFEVFSSYDEFCPVKDVSGMTNKELLRLMTTQIIDMGYDILIRDVSFLGYPSFHIVIPDVSEVFEMDSNWFNAFNTKFHLLKLVNFPEQINCNNVKFLIGTMDFFANSLLENSMRSYSGVLSNAEYPGEEYGLGWLYATAMGLTLCGDYQNAAERMKMLVTNSKDTAPFYLAVYYYLSGMSVIKDHEKTMTYLSMFFDNDIFKRINEIFCDPTNIFIKQYQRIDFTVTGENADIKSSDYPVYKELVLKYKQAQIDTSTERDTIPKLFRSLNIIDKGV